MINRTVNAIIRLSVVAILTSACTEQIPGVFRFAQQEEAFDVSIEVNTRIDILWVVDNSASMDASQEKLRQGFAGFAQSYMQPTWDIRTAVMTSDAFMANPSLNDYLNRTVNGSTSWVSPAIAGKAIPFVNPAWNPNLVVPATGAFTTGIEWGEFIPLWGPDYAKLLPGIHDGPITGLCFEALPYFLNGVTDCMVRDDQAITGPEKCINPGAGEDAESQCVNTVQNDTVRSGRPIIETRPPEGTPGDQAWVDQLVDDFTVNVSVSSNGHGSERPLLSLAQFLTDNEAETSPSKFFREDSLRVIVFATDEDDQSMLLPGAPPADFTPFSDYACDQAGLVALNGAGITGMNGYCCDVPANNCTFGDAGTTCAAKSIDGYVYTPSVCPNPASLEPVSTFKNDLDAFFEALDGEVHSESTYFVATITPLTGQSIQDLQAMRDAQDIAVGATRTHAVDRADRLLDFGNLVGDSLELDIAENDYTTILDQIGQKILQKKAKFETNFTIGAEDELFIVLVNPDGSEETVPQDKYITFDHYFQITDLQYLQTKFQEGVQIKINYQPGAQF